MRQLIYEPFAFGQHDLQHVFREYRVERLYTHAQQTRLLIEVSGNDAPVIFE
ncbi:hypothetical protein D3C87_2101730 [compost metagenome]